MTRKLRVLIVDDEELARGRIRDLLAEVPDFAIAEECADGPAAVRAIGASAPDLLFLDVQMPAMDGFEVLRKVDVSRIPAIVFVTAYDRYAVQAFEFVALDYLLKPFDRARFLQALDRARQRIAEREAGVVREQIAELLSGLERKWQERIVVREAGRVSFLPVHEIRWIEAQGNYVKIHADHDCPLLRRTLGDFEERLDPRRFARIHRSSIVNMGRVRRLDPRPHGEYQVTLDDGTELMTRRGFRTTLDERFPDML